MRNYDNWRNGIIKISGIYVIENTATGKMYVGQSVDIGNRWSRHISNHLNENDKHYEQEMYADMRKYGIHKFKFEVFGLYPQDELDFYERRIINQMIEFDDELYNCDKTTLDAIAKHKKEK